jgi:hypothetical protein
VSRLFADTDELFWLAVADDSPAEEEKRRSDPDAGPRIVSTSFGSPFHILVEVPPYAWGVAATSFLGGLAALFGAPYKALARFQSALRARSIGANGSPPTRHAERGSNHVSSRMARRDSALSTRVSLPEARTTPPNSTDSLRPKTSVQSAIAFASQPALRAATAQATTRWRDWPANGAIALPRRRCQLARLTHHSLGGLAVAADQAPKLGVRARPTGPCLGKARTLHVAG